MANVKRNQLSSRAVKSLSKPGAYTDGGGLLLRVQESGSKSWVLRLTVDGKRRNFGLGGYPGISLASARELAEDMRQRVRQGLEPTSQPVRREVPTFGELAETVIQFRAPTWTSERHEEQWRESLRLHAAPVLDQMPVDTIATADVLDVLMPIWTDKAETATRVQQRMAVIFDFAIAKGWRADNPCNGALKAALPPRKRTRQHHPALHYTLVAAAIEDIRVTRTRPAVRLALEYLILTAARAGEVRLATWDEIDVESAVWNVPAAHMKMRRPHRVPLSKGALDVLGQARSLKPEGGLVFPSNRTAGPLSNMAFTMLLRRAGFGHITTHGFRASFRTFALEQTDAPWAVAESALAHNLGGGEVVAYIRGDLFDRRRELMEEWSSYIAPEDGR